MPAFTPPSDKKNKNTPNQDVRVKRDIDGEGNSSDTPNDSERKLNAFSRAFSVASTEAGRASQFVRIVAERNKDKTGGNLPIILELDADTSRGLSNQYGYVVFANIVDNDCMWHLMIFESEVRSVKAEVRKDNNRESRRGREGREDVYEFWSTVDAVTDAVVNKINDFVTENINVNGKYYYSNATIVPAELSIDEVSSNLVSMLCYDAEDSNILVSGVDQQFSAKILRDKSRLRAVLEFGNREKNDVTGLPLRSDFSISIEEQFRDKSLNPLLAANGSRTIVEMDGYTNLRYVGQSDDGSSESYTPEITIVEIKTAQPGCVGGNFGRTLLALAMLPVLKDGDPWLKQFESSIHSTNELSAYAYPMEWPEGRPDDLGEVDKNQEYAEKFLYSILHKSDHGRIPVEFAILIKEGGVSYSTNKLLLDVAADDVGSIDKFISAADALTNDKFSELYEVVDGRDVVAGMMRVPYGYYNTSTGKRDIEHIDSMHVFNALKDNYPEMLNDYLDICQVEDRVFDESTSMTKLIKILQHVTGNEFVLKGFSTKLYLVPECVIALHESVQSKDAALNVEIDSNFDYTRRSTRRPYRSSRAGFTESATRNRSLHNGVSRRAHGTRYRS